MAALYCEEKHRWRQILLPIDAKIWIMSGEMRKMGEITAGAVKSLREKTGAGMMECKNALTQAEGNEERAIDFLRKRGLASAKKKEGRIAAEGAVGSYIHMGGKVGVLVEINCETDFVARSEEFLQLVKDVAMHIAAAEPRYVSRSQVPPDALDKEREIARAQAQNDPKNVGKPDQVIEKIVEGRLNKYYEETVLLDQPFVKDPAKTIGDLVLEKIATIKENIAIRRFTRYKMGEGLEKRADDFGGEVAALAGGK
jgi:elongation factor Ts